MSHDRSHASSLPTPPTRVALHDRTHLVLIVLLLIVAALAWWYTLAGASGDMSMMSGMSDRLGVSLSSPVAGFGAFLPMWTVMMAAMMFPSAQPIFLTTATIYRQRHHGRLPLPLPLLLFGVGYLAVWAAIGIPAFALGVALDEVAAQFSLVADIAPYAGAAILLGAAAYQLSDLKVTCLSHCRTPFHFLMAHWRDGRRGAVVMGVEHGRYCIGCCWALMAVLFVVGVMNLAWMAVLTLAITLERIGPWPRAARHGTAAALGVAGILMAIDPAYVPGFA